MAEEDFSGTFYENLRSIITLVDHLRDAGLQRYIKLPRIATLGTQSSGKSSVLESIVGLNFLPRGEGVVTRRPLELRLVHTYDSSKPWGKFEGNETKFTNFDEVRRQIDRLTDEVAGRNKEIVDDPIILTIYSNTCPDLTLIDLPGITRIPIAGQPKDIERITKEMAYRYVSDPRTIILCVIPSNQDMSISEALQMAKKVDSGGTRTLGVLTKIDIMDKGTNAAKMLQGKEVPLRLGYVGVKNRSQQDIQGNMSVEQALREEQEYFARHEIYSSLPQNLLGTQNLTGRLTKVLFTHIKTLMPDILHEVVLKLKECEERVIELGPSAPTDPKQKVQLLWNMVTDFVEIYKSVIRGKYDRKRSSRLTKDLNQGTDIKMLFKDLLNDFTGDYQATKDCTDDDIKLAIAMHEGDSIPGFPSVDVFIYLIMPQLERLREPVLDALSQTHQNLESLSHMIIERVFYRFPPLIGEMCEVASRVLMMEKENCRSVVDRLIDAEESYIFTNDIEYLSNRSDIVPKGDGRKTDSQLIYVQEVRARIDAYFRLVIRNVRDNIPKIIGFFMVRSSMDKLQYEMYNYINSNESILNYMNEPEAISKERGVLKTQLDTLRKAQKIIKMDPQ